MRDRAAVVAVGRGDERERAERRERGAQLVEVAPLRLVAEPADEQPVDRPRRAEDLERRQPEAAATRPSPRATRARARPRGRARRRRGSARSPGSRRWNRGRRARRARRAAASCRRPGLTRSTGRSWSHRGRAWGRFHANATDLALTFCEAERTLAGNGFLHPQRLRGLRLRRAPASARRAARGARRHARPRTAARRRASAAAARCWSTARPVVSCNLSLAEGRGQDGHHARRASTPSERERFADGVRRVRRRCSAGSARPGIVVRAKALLDKKGADLDRDDVARHLGAHLCRCTGYVKILDAVELLAKGETGRAAAARRRRHERRQVRGPSSSRSATSGYVDDLRVPGHAARRAAPHRPRPRRHRRASTRRRPRRAPGVVARVHRRRRPRRAARRDHPQGLAGVHPRGRAHVVPRRRARVRRRRRPRQQARAAAALVEVDVPTCCARSPIRSPRIDDPRDRGVGHRRQRAVASASTRAATSTPRSRASAHVGARGVPDPAHRARLPRARVDARRARRRRPVHVYSGGQGVWDDRDQIASVLGIDPQRVTVELVSNGGAFGGKEDMANQAQTALAAWLLDAPVKCTLSREESLLIHPKRHPIRIEYSGRLRRRRPAHRAAGPHGRRLRRRTPSSG